MIPTPRLRGFAAMSLEDRTRIARLGGYSVPAAKRSFSTNLTLAANAGAKGGRSPGRKDA